MIKLWIYDWIICFFVFFFSSRRRHTRYWRDWSSDVCSSDLVLHCHLHRALTGSSGYETCEEVLQGNALCRVCSEYFRIDSFNHLVRNLLADLYTGIVSSLLFVITGSGTYVHTFDELIHISRINLHTTYKIFLESLCLRITHGIAHGVHIIFQISPWS